MVAKLVLVTGASSGIGEATAKLYGARGAHVLLLARNGSRLDAVAQAIRKDGGTATAFPVDLADEATTASSVRFPVSGFSRKMIPLPGDAVDVKPCASANPCLTEVPSLRGNDPGAST